MFIVLIQDQMTNGQQPSSRSIVAFEKTATSSIEAVRISIFSPPRPNSSERGGQ